MPHGTPNPVLISHQKCYSPHPFSDLASNIISSLSDQKLFRLERQHKIHSEFACYRSFLYSFGIETTERLKLSQSSLQTNMCEVYIGIPFSDRNDTNTIPFGAAPYIREYPGGGGTLGISGWGCAAGTLEPLTYTRASSAEFCYPILE